jgi:hypothetical protein
MPAVYRPRKRANREVSEPTESPSLGNDVTTRDHATKILVVSLIVLGSFVMMGMSWFTRLSLINGLSMTRLLRARVISLRNC